MQLSGAGWAGILTKQAGGDEEAVFGLFFELFEDYVRERDQSGDGGIKVRYEQMTETLRSH